MPANGLIVIAPVRAGTEAALLEALNRFGNDIRGVRAANAPDEPRVEFTRGRSFHFARLTLLDDPDRGPGRKRLLFATDYDGSWEAHVSEVLALTRHPDQIWGCCEGYAGAESFPAFIRRYTVEPGAYYIAFRGDTLGRIQGGIELREWFQAKLADPQTERVFPALRDALRIGQALQAARRAAQWPVDAVSRILLAAVEIAVLINRFGFRAVIRAAMQINATLDRVRWIRPFNFLLGNRHAPPPHTYSQAAANRSAGPAPSGYPPEDAVLQNQLTLVTEIRPEHLRRLRAVLALIDLYGRRLSTPGSLVGISTIHTVRWAVIDGGRRLLMVSNYDGTWENYIDEFAEMILSGLDALWTSAPDFPKAGAQDVAALKQFLRKHQAPASAFYSAYPAASVLNLKQDLEFSSGCRWVIGRIARDLPGRSRSDETLGLTNSSPAYPREALRAGRPRSLPAGTAPVPGAAFPTKPDL
jgi:hypothetical protein